MSVQEELEGGFPPVMAVGDIVPDAEGISTLSAHENDRTSLQDWIAEGQSHVEGEDSWALVLTFPALLNPVTVSAFTELASEETQKELELRRLRVIIIVGGAGIFQLKGFQRTVDQVWFTQKLI